VLVCVCNSSTARPAAVVLGRIAAPQNHRQGSPCQWGLCLGPTVRSALPAGTKKSAVEMHQVVLRAPACAAVSNSSTARLTARHALSARHPRLRGPEYKSLALSRRSTREARRLPACSLEGAKKVLAPLLPARECRNTLRARARWALTLAELIRRARAQCNAPERRCATGIKANAGLKPHHQARGTPTPPTGPGTARRAKAGAAHLGAAPQRPS